MTELKYCRNFFYMEICESWFMKQFFRKLLLVCALQIFYITVFLTLKNVKFYVCYSFYLNITITFTNSNGCRHLQWQKWIACPDYLYFASIIDTDPRYHVNCQDCFIFLIYIIIRMVTFNESRLLVDIFCKYNFCIYFFLYILT